MAKILLIETSSEVCSTAISVDGKVVAISENPETQSHAALLTLQVDECCRTAHLTLAQLDAVAVSKGPGSYTALRVGSSVAKGICYALDKPLLAIDTLQALAFAAQNAFAANHPATGTPSTIFFPMLDARRQEVWLAAYDAALNELLPAQPLILENNSFEMFAKANLGSTVPGWIVLAGNGMKKVRSGSFPENVSFSEVEKCSARHLSLLAEQHFQSKNFQDIAYFEPIYMKPPNITTPGKPLF